MARPYTPPKTSTAAKVIAHLQRHGGSIDRDRIAKLCEVKPHCVKQNLSTAVEHGLLQQESEGRSFTWSLPAALPHDGNSDLQIASWSDGDVTVKGLQVNEDDSVTFSRNHLQQFLLHITRPAVALPLLMPTDVAAQPAAPAQAG